MSPWRRTRDPAPDPATDERVRETEDVRARLQVAVRRLGAHVEDLRELVARERQVKREGTP